MADKSTKQKHKQLILRALTDPKFRKLLRDEPHKALGKTKLTPQNLTEVKMLLASIKSLEAHINNLSDSLLCNGGSNGACKPAVA